ncbi:hypothetical protein BIY40_00595 [Pediococcus acidilactici]|nr:hypothetical protein BIY40_00595 [Pediococcus acidilactici]
METKKRFKMYKSGKKWLVVAIAAGGIATAGSVASANADEVATTNAPAQAPQTEQVQESATAATSTATKADSNAANVASTTSDVAPSSAASSSATTTNAEASKSAAPTTVANQITGKEDVNNVQKGHTQTIMPTEIDMAGENTFKFSTTVGDRTQTFTFTMVNPEIGHTYYFDAPNVPGYTAVDENFNPITKIAIKDVGNGQFEILTPFWFERMILLQMVIITMISRRRQ